MALLPSLWRHAAWIAAPALVASVLLLAHCIAGVLRNERQARIATLPLVASQEVEIPRAGTVVLATQGPILSRRFAGLRYALVGPDGREVPGRPSIFRMRSSGLWIATMEARVLDVPRAGRYELRVRNLGEARPDDADHALVLKRPTVATSMAWVAGIVLSAAFAISSLVVFLMRLVGVR